MLELTEKLKYQLSDLTSNEVEDLANYLKSKQP